MHFSVWFFFLLLCFRLSLVVVHYARHCTCTCLCRAVGMAIQLPTHAERLAPPCGKMHSLHTEVPYCLEETPSSIKRWPCFDARCIRGCVANEHWVQNRWKVEYQLGGVACFPHTYTAQYSTLARLDMFRWNRRDRLTYPSGPFRSEDTDC